MDRNSGGQWCVAPYYVLRYSLFMISLLLKKNFYDGWDNMFKLFFLNLAAFLIICGTVSLAMFFLKNGIYSFLLVCGVAALGIIIFCIYILALSVGMAEVAGYKQFRVKNLPAYIGDVWKDGILFGLTVCAWILIVVLVIPWYLRQGTIPCLALAAIMFWCALITLLMAQWYIPVRSQIPRPFKKSVKKCLLLFFDNPGFSLFLLLYNLVCGVLSIFLLTLVPGVAGIVLNLNNALRLRLYKYDWIEEQQKTNPDFDVATGRKAVPWETLLEEDVESTGTRTLRNFILPWKD